ncbi:Crp/Fnr family transcriptional regulator [Sulfuricella sp. T08]|uniref:Crp/Fnr family transcriptional regulator n=1 Tax=Sulfuricella sp. T08 TaxID=1632857 RepID=UPI0006179908|nr:Crp/Fnr family transcriptional regulator [Sulfuricella sp. T08]GAO37748.1 Crp/Fnr family transcriptional regulator [Sulfuricella sp. T08]
MSKILPPVGSDCVSCSIRKTVLFAGLEISDCESIHHPIDDIALAPNEVLYRAGDTARAVFTIRSGLLKLVQYLPDGRQRIVRLLRATDVTGLEALLGQSYQHDAIVLHQSEICRIPLEVIQRLDQDNHKLRKELMVRWQRALDEADAWLTQLATGSARARMARLLLRLVSGREGGSCELFGREDMGSMLGITTETASRIIAEFKRSGALQEIPGSVSLKCDTATLNKIAAD